jgi:hypothetical protein
MSSSVRLAPGEMSKSSESPSYLLRSYYSSVLPTISTGSKERDEQSGRDPALMS